MHTFPSSDQRGDQMRRAVLGAIMLLTSASAAFACGTERWPVKVGTDRDGGNVATSPQVTTIVQLRSIAAPARPNSRRYPCPASTGSLNVLESLLALR